MMAIVFLIVVVLISISTDITIHPSLVATGGDAYQTPGVLAILIPEWFIYGIILGMIYGKVKNRKSLNTKT